MSKWPLSDSPGIVKHYTVRTDASQTTASCLGPSAPEDSRLQPTARRAPRRLPPARYPAAKRLRLVFIEVEDFDSVVEHVGDVEVGVAGGIDVHVKVRGMIELAVT